MTSPCVSVVIYNGTKLDTLLESKGEERREVKEETDIQVTFSQHVRNT